MVSSFDMFRHKVRQEVEPEYPSGLVLRSYGAATDRMLF